MDVIRLLPDHIANQIAAGEVVVRPASIVKELLENAIDAGSTHIKVFIRQGGKTFIQVIDDGCGMSETDARRCFERHATSKISKAEDLFKITTKGFRGEAMASIAAVAQVDLKTRRQEDEVATRVYIAGSQVETQEYVQAPKGTNLVIKNLFYNIPARRNFLKSDLVEYRNCMEEFQRVAIPHHDIHFQFYHNDEEIYHLTPGTLRQRLVNIFGKNINESLVPLDEKTEIVKINGFIAKPEYARKSRGEQFFFVNRRYIRSPYLHHAVKSAFENLLPEDTHPFYAVFMEVDPATIDVNVHPTKQEIKFQEERLIYNFLLAATKKALGQFQVVPSMDFERSPFDVQAKDRYTMDAGGTQGPFSGSAHVPSSAGREAWRQLYEGIAAPMEREKNTEVTLLSSSSDEPLSSDEYFEHKEPQQILSSYILVPVKSGFMLIDQQGAHERILYEYFLQTIHVDRIPCQQLLFPLSVELPAGDAQILNGILPEINKLGFDVQPFGGNTFIVHGLPAVLHQRDNPEQVILHFVSQFKQQLDLKLDHSDRLARSLAFSTACKRGQKLSMEEQKSMIDHLFACSMPYRNPSGKPCAIIYDSNKLEKLFQN